MNPTITFPFLGDWLVINIPRYFTIFGFRIYYYAICIVIGFGLAALYLIKRHELFGLTTDNILDLVLIAVPCGIIGARIYYMLFNFDDFFGPGKWGNILGFRDGGLAVYGGIIASGLGVYIYCRKKKIPIGNMLDAAGFGLFIGQAIGRWGNFINREAYGVETNLPWKMGLTTFGTTTYHHPAFLYESLWNACGLLIIHIFSKRFKTKYPGQYFLFYVAWYGLGRFMIEGLRTDSLYIPGTELRVSQWLAAASFLAALGILLYNHFKKDDVLDAGEDTSGMPCGDDDDIDELASLDGATAEDVDCEDSADPAQRSEDSGSSDDTDELASLDGATTEDLSNEDYDGLRESSAEDIEKLKRGDE